MGALSNFPPPKECNNFMRHQELYLHATEYFKQNDVFRHVHYNTEVISVKKSSDYDETGRWVVRVKDRITNEFTTDVYDGVLVCTGHMNRPKMPTYPGQEQFKGRILHSHSLKGVSPYQRKNVVVVGMGCSGLDAAVETSNVAKQVYLSTRTGAHIINRLGDRGLPYDHLLLRRYLCLFIDILPINVASWILETCYLDLLFDQKLYAVKPKHGILSQDPSLNDHIGSKLMSGHVIMKPNIKCFTEDGVIFEGDSEVTEVDSVIMATGYTWQFPFLEEGIVEQENGRINLYKCIYPSELQHGTLGIIGFILPLGPGFPTGEIQCRWAVQVLAGKCKLPSKAKMYADIKKRYETNIKRYKPNNKMSIRVDYVQSYEKPIWSKAKSLKPLLNLLFPKNFFGPVYRIRYLRAPAWGGGKLMTSEGRSCGPFPKGKTDKKEGVIY
ncbi:dimethylaniline monooxygenase 5 [Trichonephila inaurata madagascariensis]|uniref:Flavin-containing monooxygenase n=1 Tax=Trichonephila inaurata madagascariensis TaxID=2747483 RepID=A0A8X7CPN8_9ARAC|nr:dimethylaniline monooxygenase 5 [Trichonephila inaurata madagascariensis]